MTFLDCSTPHKSFTIKLWKTVGRTANFAYFAIPLLCQFAIWDCIIQNCAVHEDDVPLASCESPPSTVWFRILVQYCFLNHILLWPIFLTPPVRDAVLPVSIPPICSVVLYWNCGSTSNLDIYFISIAINFLFDDTGFWKGVFNFGQFGHEFESCVTITQTNFDILMTIINLDGTS